MSRQVTDNPAFVQIAMAAAGLPLEQATQAAFDLLAQCIGLMTSDLEEAQRAARKTGDDLARAIADNWQELAQARRLMETQAGTKQ